MTLAIRDQEGHTRTFYQDGSRIRIANPSGDDDGEAHIVDLKTTEHVIVYDDAKTYYDFNKSIAGEHVEKTPSGGRKKPAPVVSYRALGKARHVAGLACAMYERLVDGTLDARICFAPWGGAVGSREDFAWFDALVDRVTAELPERNPARRVDAIAKAEGLVLWRTRVNDDGSTDTIEIVKLDRDPVPAALLHVPPDYKEFSRPLTASEHPKVGPPPMDDGDAHRSPRIPKGYGGIVALVLAFGLIVGVLINAALLHLAASIVIDQARFLQAVVATLIVWGVTTVVELIGLPSVITTVFVLFSAFAGLKITYGASVARTLALCVVSVLVVLAVAYLAHGCGLIAGGHDPAA